MSPKPDITEQAKLDLVAGIPQAQKEAIESLRPYKLNEVSNDVEGQTTVDIYIDEKGNAIHRMTKHADGTITMMTLDRINPEQTITDENPEMIEPLRIAMRNILQDLMMRRFGHRTIELAKQDPYHGPIWINKINQSANHLCELVLGNLAFRNPSNQINAVIEQNIINFDVSRTAAKIRNTVRDHEIFNFNGITVWQYNTAKLAGSAIFAMLNTENQRAFANYFWNAMAARYWWNPEPSAFPKTETEIRQAVVDHLKLNEEEAEVFSKVNTKITDKHDPESIRIACQTLKECSNANNNLLQRAYDMNVSQAVAEWQWEHGNPEQAWTSTVKTLLNHPDTTEQDLDDVQDSFRDALGYQQPWPAGDANHYLDLAKRPRAANSNLGVMEDNEGIRLACKLEVVTIQGLTLRSLTTAQKVADAELQMGIKLTHTWKKCRNYDTQAYIVQMSDTVVAVATIKKSRYGWQLGDIISPAETQAPLDLRKIVERMAVLYSHADESQTQNQPPSSASKKENPPTLS